MNSLEKIFGNRLLLDEPMSRHSTLRIGGTAKYFLSAKTSEEVKNAIAFAKDESIQYICIGGGSNILVSDSGFGGLVIQAQMNDIKIEGNRVYADAGVFSAVLSRRAGEAGFSGLEWMVTLPGTVGGAIYGNAGAYGEETKDKLTRVLILEGDKSEWLQKEDCKFGYRDSRFKKTKEIILGVEFVLETRDREQVTRKMNELLGKRKDEQPLGASSAGCIFKNFQFSISNFQFQVPEEFLKNKIIPAGWLIDRAGLKGFCVGKTCISDIHGNFSLTQNGAKASELIQLISEVKIKVRDTFGIELREEIQYIGF